MTPEQTLSPIELVNSIYQWAVARNFYGDNGATVIGQQLKLFEEIGELNVNLRKKKSIVDDIGDVFVVCVVLAGFLPETERGRAYSSFAEYVTLGPAVGKKDAAYSMQEMVLRLYQFAVDAFVGGPTNYDLMVIELTYIAQEIDTDLRSCIQHAYDEIKYRRGKMIGGMFIKEVDLLAMEEYANEQP